MFPKLDRLKWILANTGWPMAFTFWFQVIVVLFSSTNRISFQNLIYFHFLWIIIVCAFFSASFTPPKKFLKKLEEKENPENFCSPCSSEKPPRWHHCRRCNQCVYRMDHHCPILQLCIHRDNHKFFLLFLLWPLQLAVFTVYHGYYDLWKVIRATWTYEELDNAEQFRGTGVSNAVMVGFAALYLLKDQLPNLLRNQTLIEQSRGVTDYDLGSWQVNFKSIMGPWRIAWLPVSVDNDEERKNQ